MQTLRHEKPSQSKSSVIYSLSHHHKQSCLLTAASRGPVRVWKVKGWEEEADEEEEEEKEAQN